MFFDFNYVGVTIILFKTSLNTDLCDDKWEFYTLYHPTII